MKLILLRHGNTFEANQIAYQVGLKTDLPLTEKGMLQAKTFAQQFQDQNRNIAAIFCGQLQRQRQTADLIANYFPKARRDENINALNEIDYGDWEGLTADAIDAKWPQEHANWQHQAIWPKHFGSSLETHIGHLKQFLARLKDYQPNDTVVAVTSNGIMRLFLCLIPNLWSELSQSKSFNDFKVKTGNYCEIEILNEELIIQQWNVHPSLNPVC